MSSPLKPLTQVSRYQVQQLVGQGSFSRVYQAIDTAHRNRPQRALLELIVQGSEDEVQLRRRTFKRTADVLAKLNRENRNHLAIPKVYQIFEEDHRLFLVQEFIEGITYAQFLEDHSGPLEAKELERLCYDVLGGLSKLHRAQIVHRDIKPGNLMRRQSDGLTTIIDFGSACDLDQKVGPLGSGRLGGNAADTQIGGAAATEIGHTRIYTPGYAHPDQRDGLVPATPQWDLYALAKTIVALRLGSNPPWLQSWSLEELGFSPRMQGLLREMLKSADCQLQDAGEALQFDPSLPATEPLPRFVPPHSGNNRPKQQQRDRHPLQRWVWGGLAATAALSLAATAAWLLGPGESQRLALGRSLGFSSPLKAQLGISPVSPTTSAPSRATRCPNYISAEPNLPVPNRGFAARFYYPETSAQGDTRLQVWRNGKLISEARDSDIQGFIWIKTLAAEADFPSGEYELRLLVPASTPYRQQVAISPEFPFHYLGRVSALKVGCLSP